MGGILRTVGQFGAFALGAAVGGPLGGAVANTLFNIFLPPDTSQPGSQLSDLMREGAQYDEVIAEFFGTMRCRGSVIDCGVDANGKPAGIEEVVTKKKSHLGTGGGGGSNTNKEYAYYLTAAYLLGAGPLFVDQVIREDADGSEVIYDRWKNGEDYPVPGSDEWADFWKDVYTGDETYNTGSGIEMTPETEDGFLIAEHSQTMHFYPGTERQKPDSTLETIHGVGNVASYRGSAYVMFNRYGPLNGATSFTFVVRSLINGRREIIKKRLCDSGIAASRVMIDSLDGTLRGAAITAIEPARQLPEKIAGAVFHDLLFINGAFRDASRANPAFWIITPGTTGAHVVNGVEDGLPSKSSINLKHSKELPSRLLVRFSDKNLNYEINTAIASRESAPFENEASLEFPFASTLQEVSKVADITLDEMWSVLGEEKIDVMPYYLQIAPGNVVLYADSTGTRVMRVVEEDIQTKGPISLSGTPYDQGVYGIHRLVEDIVADRPVVMDLAAPIVYMGNLPAPFQDDLRDKPLLTWAATTPSDKRWTGAYIISDDNELDGKECAIPAVIGELVDDFEFTEDQLAGFNSGLTCQIQLLGRGSMASADSEADVLNGANQVALGDLIVSFITATDLGSGIVELSDIWPGRYGTDHIQSVPAGTRTLQLQNNVGVFDLAISYLSMPMSRNNTEIDYEVVAAADDTKTTGVETVEVLGNNLIPPRPTLFKVGNAGGYDVKIYTRTRDQDSVEAWYATGFPVVDTDPRKVVILLLDGMTEVDRRTVEDADLPLVTTYTEADLISWFGSVPATLTGQVWQVGKYLPGKIRSFTI